MPTVIHLYAEAQGRTHNQYMHVCTCMSICIYLSLGEAGPTATFGRCWAQGWGRRALPRLSGAGRERLDPYRGVHTGEA